jgi:hypothetical protein
VGRARQARSARQGGKKDETDTLRKARRAWKGEAGQGESKAHRWRQRYADRKGNAGRARRGRASGMQAEQGRQAERNKLARRGRQVATRMAMKAR